MHTKGISRLSTSSFLTWQHLVCLLCICQLFTSESFSAFERSQKMTWFDFISSFGGFCGLCLGISFVSVIEIFYWFSIRLCRNIAVWIRKIWLLMCRLGVISYIAFIENKVLGVFIRLTAYNIPGTVSHPCLWPYPIDILRKYRCNKKKKKRANNIFRKSLCLLWPCPMDILCEDQN